ncbi:MAG: hypothetical protein K2L17_06275 [Muribaculaceae bacterium]|nr:hypothetical protein [Muribaculaceae bacterium]
MKHLVTLIALLTALALSQGCRRHASTVAPYGWPSITPAFDSLTMAAENMYFIATDPDRLQPIVDSMKSIANDLKGQNGIDARACADYWQVYKYMVDGSPDMVKTIIDSVRKAAEMAAPDDYIQHRLMDFDNPYFRLKTIETFKELLASLDYYREIEDLPQAGNIAVLLSNSLQYVNSPNLALFYLQMADSLYTKSGREMRRVNVRLNEPTVLCRAGYLDEGRAKIDALLADSDATGDLFTREVLLRNRHCFFKDSASLFEGYHIVNILSEYPELKEPFSETKALYEALLCAHYMRTGRPDSAAYYFTLSHGTEVNDWDFQKEVYGVYSRYLESIGKDREALRALRRCIAANDSINKNNDPEKKEYLERVNALRQHEAEAERERQAIESRHYTVAVSLVILLLLSLIAVQWIRHRNKIKTIGLQLEAEKMERQILAMSLSREESEKVLDKVKEETARLRLEGSVSAKDLTEIETNIKMHFAGKEEMMAFEKTFAEVSPEFAERLKVLSPTISPNNIRLCTYLYMGLSSQQVCGILNVTPGALRQAKRRLRQRFGLSGDDSLEDFLRALVK